MIAPQEVEKEQLVLGDDLKIKYAFEV